MRRRERGRSKKAGSFLTCALGLQGAESTGDIKRRNGLGANLENKRDSRDNPEETMIVNYIARHEAQEPEDWPHDGEVPAHSAIALSAPVHRSYPCIPRAQYGRGRRRRYEGR